jgi:cyanophycin synthetase
MDEKQQLNSQSAQLIFEAFQKTKVDVRVVSKRFNLLQINHNGKSFFAKSTSFWVNPQPSCIIANNKFLTKKVLRQAKVSIPKSYLVKTLKQAKDVIIEKNMFPFVVKPTEGAHGNGVYANIESLEELDQVAKYVFNSKKSEDVLIEQYISGPDYRVMVVGDKISAVMERMPAHVVGDGVSTLRKLITKFNQNPLVGKKYEKPMCKIILNGEVKRILKKKGINLVYVPKNDEKVFLRQNANISTGGIGKDVTNKVRQSVKDLAIKATKALQMKIAGVDILFDEKSKIPYVLEINDTPGIDIHHYPVIGESQNVAQDIADFLVESIIE